MDRKIVAQTDSMEQAHVFVTMVQQQMRFEYGGIRNLQQGIQRQRKEDYS